MGDIYLSIELQRPDSDSIVLENEVLTYGYYPGDCSVGDVDADGEYELIVKWDPSRSADNAMEQTITIGESIDDIKLKFKNCNGIGLNLMTRPDGSTVKGNNEEFQISYSNANKSYTIKGKPNMIGDYEVLLKKTGRNDVPVAFQYDTLKVHVLPDPTSINDVQTNGYDVDANPDYYDISGKRLSSASKGIFIEVRKDGNKAVARKKINK